MSTAERPTVDEWFLAIGWSCRYLRYSSGVSPETREMPEHIRVEEEQLGGPRAAQTRGVLDNGVQHVPRVGERAAERREDLAAGRGLVARVSQLLVLPERGSLVSAGRAFARFGHSLPPSATSIQVLCLFCGPGSRT